MLSRFFFKDKEQRQPVHSQKSLLSIENHRRARFSESEQITSYKMQHNICACFLKSYNASFTTLASKIGADSIWFRLCAYQRYIISLN